MQDVQTPPLRTLGDFLLGSARFALPDLRNPERVNHRIINNLLYYQTNYLVSALGFLLVPGVFRLFQLVLETAVVVVLFVGFVWAAENYARLRRFRRNHPSFCLLAILLASYIILSLLGSVSIFLFGIVFPILLVVIHASLRLRNLKNKMENKLESIGLKRTPMGLMLEALGQEQEAGS
ncbi:PRA1 family protein 3 [Merluccius polli]|uniref:PRA1 family protein n=1 Tax=Merluccius polli TaxID=89951 RepID=A0AA47M980_MERPO|nr:PRA1 family protein 3 [Merluccius polli]